MITIENAIIRFRNFAGAPDKFNPRGGKRSFAVFIDPEFAEELRRQGWNVKTLQPREEGDTPQDYLPVKVTFGRIPPKIAIVNPDGSQTHLDEETVKEVDTAEIENCDLVVRPYDWEVNGNTGRSAYVKSMYITLQETELDRKYRLMSQNGEN